MDRETLEAKLLLALGLIEQLLVLLVSKGTLTKKEALEMVKRIKQ